MNTFFHEQEKIYREIILQNGLLFVCVCYIMVAIWTLIKGVRKDKIIGEKSIYRWENVLLINKDAEEKQQSAEASGRLEWR